MKQFLHSSTRRLPFAALALGLALAFAPSQAAADPSFLRSSMEISTDDGPQQVTVRCASADNPNGNAVILVYVADVKKVRLYEKLADGTMATVGGSDAQVRMSGTVGSFFIEPIAAGSATVTAELDGVTATMTVNVTGSSTASQIKFVDENNNPLVGNFVAVGEGGDTRRLTITPALDYEVTSDDDGTHLQYDSSAGVLTLTGIDNPVPQRYIRLTFTGGEISNALLQVSVTNTPPQLAISTDPKNPTPWGSSIFKNQGALFPVSAAGATDASAVDQTNLTYKWSFSSVSTKDPDAVYTNSWASPTQEGGFQTISIRVSDGTDAVTGYYSVIVDDSVTLYTDTTAPWSGLAKNGGIAQATTFHISNPPGVAWELFDGTTGKAEVGPKTSVSINADLEPGSYPFGWYGDTEYLRAPYATRVPNPNLKAIVTMPEEGDVTVLYFASYPYYTQTAGKGAFLNTELTDEFGDFDGDGLSDTWEDYYFQENMDPTSDQTTSLPVGIATGEYGPAGNIDGDWLPTSLFEPAPDKGNKIGWPAEDPENPGVTNRYRVYKYPLDFSTGGETYNKSAYDEKPLFGNFVEYRGLAENKSGDNGEDPTKFVYYAPEFINQQTAADGFRGNCSGTDPENYDSDGDGFSDGWEFYFWTTIRYRVNTQNWRAWDPTYSLYSTASATAGIPLLRTDDPPTFTFVLYPTPSYVIDPDDETFQTTYEVDKDVVKNNNLVMPIQAGSVEIAFDNPGEFKLWTVQGRLTTDGKDALFYQQWGDPDGDGTLEPAEDEEGNPVLVQLNGAWVEGATGYMHIPGWTVLTALTDTGATEGIDQGTPVTISYTRLNGIFTQTHLLSRFDPMNWTETDMGNVKDVVKSLGLDEKKWDPDSDLDGDGVLDIEEYYLGTDPLHWDTDRDGMPDGWEVQRKLLPRDPRNGVNGCGPGDNPDEDFMATTTGPLGSPYAGTWKHAYAYAADLSNRKYWNGFSYVGFVPGLAATTGAPYSNLEEFLLSLYGFQTGFWWDEWRLAYLWDRAYTNPAGMSRYAKGIYPIDWPQTTSDPCDNDTNQNGIPDGWELYVGWNPVDGVCVTPFNLPPEDDPDGDNLKLIQEFSCVEVAERWSETRTVYIGDDASVTQSTTTTVDADGNTNTVYATTGVGTEVTIRALPHAIPEWTNKKLPTDPWNYDTDGDGLVDREEYVDIMDRNGDEVTFANFNPCTADTDLDWLPDGWEFFMGTYTTDHPEGVDMADPYGPYGDPDGDGLPNYQEYLTGANYAWRYDKWYSLDNQMIWVPQKRPAIEEDYGESEDKYGPLEGDWPYDPGLFQQYGPVVRAHQYQPMDFFTVPESVDWISEGIVALRAIEKRWGVTDDVSQSPSLHYDTVAAFFQRLTEIVFNPFGMGVSKFMDDTRPSVDPDYNTDGKDVPGKDYFLSHSAEEHWAIVHAYEGMLGYLYSHGQCGYSWDPVYKHTPSKVIWTYIPLNDNSTLSGFPGTRPKELDSDHDNMPDYWEIFHGLNPTYGGCVAVSNKAGSEPNVVPDEWDGADNWMMGNDPGFVLNMHFIPPLLPICRGEHVWYDELGEEHSFGDGETTAFGGVMERAHYDLVNRPWLAGDPSADCDHDGLNNQEESYSVFANDLLHNTDPSPYWLTDITQTYEEFGQKASYANLYYTSLGFGDDPADYWWWEYPYTGNDGCNAPPTFLWDFETNEGYDSDNNNISDREEVTDVSTRGKTDPQNLDSPLSRKAMYFDGHAACRTQRPIFHDQYALTSFTAEFWVRPKELPAPGKIATLLQRPVLMPVDVVSGSKAWDIRHTFLLYLNEMGEVCAEVDNDGIEQPANKAVLSSAGRLVPNVWTHVALVMDSQNDRLTLYLDGKHSASISTSLKPCTGTIMDTAFQSWATSGGEDGAQISSTTTVNFQYSPAPIVVGAFDTTPWSVIGLNPDAIFDENRFFKGWIDEIRVWDRCRTPSEIVNNMTKRFTKADIEAVNQPRFKWDMENLYQTNSEDTFPQKLLYLFNFDNLPDVVPAPTRSGDLVFATDTDPVPTGWAQIAATRPIPYVPWWYATANRSTVYSGDYSYVPFIENVVSHMPQRPPRGVEELFPVYDTEWNHVGYRYRLSSDWNNQTKADIKAGEKVLGDVMYTFGEEGAEALISPARLTNTMDPYGDTYSTSVCADYEVNPWNFGGMLDPYGVYDGVPIHSDMVPLLDAVADMDVPMWDGFGRGSDNNAIDSDGDGIPDWWEIAHGLDPNDATGENGAYGDIDVDGLDNYAEYLAGTDPRAGDTDNDGRSDYFSRADDRSLTFGDLYDDGDGMDNAWELVNGLDPEIYDADLDLDNDGWTNWEEFMAGTRPNDPGDYPKPRARTIVYYDGEQSEMTGLYFLTYGERVSGNRMGGVYDGRYTVPVNFTKTLVLGTDGVFVREVNSDSGLEGVFHGTYLEYGKIGAATAVVRLPDGTEESYTMAPDKGHGIFVWNNDRHFALEFGSGLLLCDDPLNGCTCTITYTVSGFDFPAVFQNLVRDPDSVHDHMVGGWNRIFGFADVNGNGEFDVDEPAGISIPRPTLVGWNAFDAEIPLTDELFAFPRLTWPASESPNVTSYRVTVSDGSDISFVDLNGNGVPYIEVQAPRTFLHEGDYIRSGVYGITFTSNATTQVFKWSVVANNGVNPMDEILASGEIVHSLVPNTGSRRAMKARSPISGSEVYGSLVEFRWDMDWRNAGVLFTIEKLDGDDAGVMIDELCVPLPVRHGRTTSDTYYYSATPQTENGKKFVSLPSGTYRYTITERPNCQASTLQPQSVSGTFRLVNDDTARSTYSISGEVKYYGKLMEDETLQTLGSAAAGDETFSGAISGANLAKLAKGSLSVQLQNGGDVVCSFSDSGANGRLTLDGTEDVVGWSGTIDYETGAILLRFAEPLPAGYSVVLVQRAFPADVPLLIRVHQVPDETTSGLSLSGSVAAQTSQSVKGPYKVTGLRRGTYVVHAFLDSNRNGIADAWETQGFGIKSGTDAPVQDPQFAPIVLEANAANVTIVLHDRDTDNDLLPDAWEYGRFGKLEKYSGYDQMSVGVYVWQEYADGILDSDPCTPDTDLDGLTDAMELLVTKSLTHRRDSDADGIGDLEEFLSGSALMDAADARPFTMPALAFDADGNPYVECAYPELAPGVVLTYTLQRKLDLRDAAWEDVAELVVAATDEPSFAADDGVMSRSKPAGKEVMKPAEQNDIDYKTGFFRIRVTADYGKMVDNGDGTCSYMTWVQDENGVWAWAEAARGTGVLVRDADGTWSFVSDATGLKSSLVRDEDGNWSFQN